MSGLGIIRNALLLLWFVSFGACVYLFLFKKRKIAAIAGLISLLSLVAFAVLGFTKNERPPEGFVQKAIARIEECRALGDRPITRSGKTLVWDLNTGHAVLTNLSDGLDPTPPDVPVTLFLISTEQNREVGRYSVSGMPAYREWFEVYVVQFRNFSDNGTALAMHQFLSSGPAQKRPVSNNPGYGDFSSSKENDSEYGNSNPPSDQALESLVEHWIDSLPTR
jgi:hypothetical protein